MLLLRKKSYHWVPFTRLSHPGTHFTAESTEAIRIKCLAQGHNILMPRFDTSTSISRSWNSNHMTSMLCQIQVNGKCPCESSVKLTGWQCFCSSNCFNFWIVVACIWQQLNSVVPVVEQACYDHRIDIIAYKDNKIGIDSITVKRTWTSSITTHLAWMTFS